jgi:hypothetical protein
MKTFITKLEDINISEFHRMNTPGGIRYANDDNSVFITKINDNEYQIMDFRDTQTKGLNP